jgi:predicted cobalt transporter CbtA
MRTFRAILVRGLIAGFFAGLLAGGFAYVMGEPSIDAAIAIEESASAAHDHGADHSHAAVDDPLVSRNGQRAGLLLATTLYGVALGGIFATAYTLLRRRLQTRDDSYAALWLAAAGFAGVVLVPFLKYPANPPAVGDPDTITRRTVSYLLAVVIGLLAVWAGAAAARWAAARPSGTTLWARSALGLIAFLATVVIAYQLLPTINEVPESFPATLLWHFRLASLGTQAVLWVVLGFAFAGLVTVNRKTPAAA